MLQMLRPSPPPPPPLERRRRPRYRNIPSAINGAPTTTATTWPTRARSTSPDGPSRVKRGPAAGSDYNQV